ncbi:MAG: DUF2304 family protein [Candidatus Magasanikbacteria bacterium]|jgi:small membrane protein|nr:DUF2304 family protein [Candidatus Magasanikbacteria bacterium]MBT4221472.1 DUF2304 family protein [Candidatus Magasanikbacteria bacterium]MBT4350680.1 DUF2304 family protein [Candidatus Magasanikbacteria bacterium]MBT4541644.1 DUF2304 family protein [Candidatus Magasanikbacteria bacterium]MBT6252913.1 DUF2304 family protein [Candidatus Magasanikbacteria bacterium]
MLSIFQILFVCFILFAIFGVVQKRRSGDLGPKGALFWVLFWIGVGVAVVWPESTAKIAHIFSIGRGVDLVLYISIATLFYLLFRLHIKIEQVGRDVTTLIRKMAIDDAKKSLKE